MTKRLVLCSCEGSQNIDAQALAQATGFSCSKVYSSLCYSQQDSAAKELSPENVLIACGQEIDFFKDLAEELEVNEPDFIDLRDRAGWRMEHFFFCFHRNIPHQDPVTRKKLIVRSQKI